MLGSSTPTDWSKKGYLFGYNWEVQDKCCFQVSNDLIELSLSLVPMVSAPLLVALLPPTPPAPSCHVPGPFHVTSRQVPSLHHHPTAHIPVPSEKSQALLITSAESHSNWTSLGHMTIPELSTAQKISTLIGKPWVTCSIPGAHLL